MAKQTEYTDLIAKRKACHRCAGLINPVDVDGGCFDCEQVGPWSRWQRNLDAKFMVIGQDWRDDRYFRVNKGWDKPDNPTSRTLMRLLASIGISIQPPGPTDQPQVFLTNAILCLKGGGMQSQVSDSWLGNCESFLRRQVEIVSPAVVVTMGTKAHRALGSAFRLPPKSLSAAIVDTMGDLLPTGSRAFSVYHCGAYSLNTQRNLKQQLEDWSRIGRALELVSLE